MKYVVSITATDGKMHLETIDGRNPVEAHQLANQYATSGATIRVYPDTTTAAGLARGAVQVAGRTAKNAVQHGGTDTQWKIWQEMRCIVARIDGAEEAERIMEVMADYSADTQDFVMQAMQGLVEAREGGQPIDAQYHAAYLSPNRLVHSQKAASASEVSIEYIRDGGGDLVAYTTAIARIISGSSKWTPTDGEGMDAATAARLGKALHEAIATLQPVQRDIIKLLAAGYSQRQVAAKLERGLSTVARHIALIRAKVADYIAQNAPDFADKIHAESRVESGKVEAAMQSSNVTAKGRTEEAQQRKAAADKATQAARAKAYRERKKAEKQPAQEANQ